MRRLSVDVTITEYIAQDLRARLQSGGPLPANLTLQGLSTHYNVSLTPVRVAVNELIEERFIRKRANGRLAVHPSRLGRRRPEGECALPEPVKDWRRIITDDVIRLSVQGEAVYLREEATARHYGIGRTVVRQVFSRLAGSGIFEHVARRGWRVRPFRAEDVVGFLEIRALLELKALDLARPRLVRAELGRMLADLSAPKDAAQPQVDAAMHQYLIDRSQNRYIQDFFRQYGSHYRILFDWVHDEMTVADSLVQHRQVLEALLAEDWALAKEALSRHIWHQRPSLERIIRRAVAEGSRAAGEVCPRSRGRKQEGS